MPQAKTVISVLSPPFAKSNGCHRMVETFWKKASESGQFQVHNRSRLLNIVKTPVENEELPLEIRSLYAGRIREQPAKYVPGGVDLRVSADDDSGSALVFETDAADKVARWRVGQSPAVDYAEGCS